MSRWYKRFDSGDITLEDRPRSKRPTVVNDNDLQDALKARLEADTCMLAKTLDCDQAAIVKHLHGDSQPEAEEAPTLIHAPVMYSAPLMASMPVSPVVHYDVLMHVVIVVEEGHLSDTTLELPFRRARARKLTARKAARMHKKSLKKHRKVNKQ
ncbi:hypothetical protein ANCCEY_13470 [Ancylostoma ceylanicum]|uniref:Mos1 transposase HTH domain-containing protein n=1 Tax=Ancylostoma ceylanicum TaxID=53326 RepID=A0A0D6L6Y5_9BILA|nr:hypothetical protein ANCCEY_13470 [Ancylostoma ceylanicum]